MPSSRAARGVLKGLRRPSTSSSPWSGGCTPASVLISVLLPAPLSPSRQCTSLRLRRGEVHCLLGDNGAGKSTLIKTLAGVHPPDQGEELVDGRRKPFKTPRAARELGIANRYPER